MTADPPVAEAEQVPGRGEAAVPVRRADRRRVVERLAGRIDDDERDARACGAGRASSRQVGEHRDDAHRPPGERALDPALAGPAAALHLGQDDGELVAPGDALDAAHDLQGPLALELVEDQLEQRRPAARAGPAAGSRARG